MEASVMGYLGPMGTHSEAAARWLSVQLARTGGGERELRPFADIDAVLHAVEAGEVASGFVPVENSLEGAIHVTLDTLARSEALVVAREVIWPVHNELMARCEAVLARTADQPVPRVSFGAFPAGGARRGRVDGARGEARRGRAAGGGARGYLHGARGRALRPLASRA